jgi:hypothetical protein
LWFGHTLKSNFYTILFAIIYLENSIFVTRNLKQQIMKVVHRKKQEIQKSLLVYADWNCTTGFGAVAKELVDEWAKDKKLSIVIFGINDRSKATYDYLPNVKVIPALQTGDKDTQKDVYRRIELLKLIYQNDFDTIFFLQDVEVINTMEEQLKDVKNTKRK